MVAHTHSPSKGDAPGSWFQISKKRNAVSKNKVENFEEQLRLTSGLHTRAETQAHTHAHRDIHLKIKLVMGERGREVSQGWPPAFLWGPCGMHGVLGGLGICR